MRRFTWILGTVVLAAGIGVGSYAGYRSLKEMRAELREIHREVNETSRLAQEESAAAAAAGRSANEAAARAEIAARAGEQAEQQKQQADSQREQAVAVAQQASQEATQAKDEMARMRHEREEELNRMQEALDRVVETHRTAGGMVIVLPNSTFRFAFDSAELNQKNRELLSRIAGILLVSKGYGLSVFGYTDDIGTEEYNQQLSMRRAKAVRDYLAQAGIDPAIINSKGYGKTSPMVNGTSAEDRAKNRRVEIALTDSSIRFDGVPPGN